MKDVPIKDTMLHQAWELCTDFFRVFFGAVFPAPRPTLFFPGVLPCTMEGTSLVYDLLMSGKGNVQDISNILQQELVPYFSEKRMTVRIFEADASTISFRLIEYPGACASLKLSKQGWKLFVPQNLLAGPSYIECVKKWDDIARNMAQIFSNRYL